MFKCERCELDQNGWAWAQNKNNRVDAFSRWFLKLFAICMFCIVILWFKNLEVALKVLKVTETTIRAISK